MLDDSGAKKKKTETAPEKQQRLVTTKLQVMLNKHKDQLKKDIVKKRALLDKTLHSEIQVNIQPRITCLYCACLILGLFANILCQSLFVLGFISWIQLFLLRI